jgi:Zn-dependent M28 family amino/carboxypeptidase
MGLEVLKAVGRAPRGWVCAVVLLNGCTVQPKAPPPSTDIDETAYRNHIWMLASDEFEGRKPGTPGADKTVAFLADHFRNLGLKPATGSGKTATFFQQVPLVEVTAGVDASLTVLGQSGSRRLKLGVDAVIWSKRAVPEVQLQRSELLFVGYGTVAPEYSWDDYAGTDVHGKTVLVLVGDPGVATQDPAVFRGKSLTEYGRWEYKVQEAARHGAAGVLLVHDAALLGYGWSTIQTTWGGSQFELAAADGYAGRAAIEGWLQADTVRGLFADAGVDFAAAAAAAAHPGFKALPLRCKVDATLHNSLRSFNSQNVVALWPGGKRKQEYILYTAHWDSLGVDAQRAATHSGHAVFDGAVDNASGAAGLLVLAQSFVRTKPVPDRSIVFLATTAGDSGQLGAIFYAENPLFPLRRTAAVIDVDGLLPGGHARDLAVFGNGNSDMEDTARAVALLQGRETHPDPFPELGLYYRADGYTFARYGVPALLAQSGTDNAARGPAWGRAQREDYLANRYHQPSDLYSPDWNVVGALDDLTLYYEVGLRVASSRRFPRWYPNSQYRGSNRHAPAAEADAD